MVEAVLHGTPEPPWRIRGYRPAVWASRKMFSAMITAAIADAATVVMRRLTSAPLMSRRAVN
ncbi:MAG TPA: hypothetical protein VNR59_12775 [Gaiellaceae bacterium]|nr:hypothetical protein [Gaiellaceae bacterium]